MRFSSMAFVAVLLILGVALGDGDGPSRPMTQQEAVAFDTVRNAIREAVPSPAPGYAARFNYESGVDERTVPQALAPGGLFRMRWRATQTRESSGSDAQDSAYRAVFVDRVRGTPEQRATLARLEARESELTGARDATRDRAEKDRLRAELKAVEAEQKRVEEQIAADYQAWAASGGAARALEELERSQPPKKLEARFLVNADVGIAEKAVPYPLDGVPLAFEQAEGCQDYDASCLTVLLGPYERKHKAGSAWLYALGGASAGGVPTRAHGIVLVVSGPRDRPESARAFLRQVDVAKLKALLR